MTPFNSSNKAIFIDTSLVIFPIVIEFFNFTDCSIPGSELEDHCNDNVTRLLDQESSDADENNGRLRSLFSWDKEHDASYMENPAGVGYKGSVEMQGFRVSNCKEFFVRFEDHSTHPLDENNDIITNYTFNSSNTTGFSPWPCFNDTMPLGYWNYRDLKNNTISTSFQICVVPEACQDIKGLYTNYKCAEYYRNDSMLCNECAPGFAKKAWEFLNWRECTDCNTYYGMHFVMFILSWYKSAIGYLLYYLFIRASARQAQIEIQKRKESLQK